MLLTFDNTASIVLSGFDNTRRCDGVRASVAVARAIRALLFGLEPLDATSFVVAVVLLVLAGGAAALVPAARATRVDPVAALRS